MIDFLKNIGLFFYVSLFFLALSLFFIAQGDRSLTMGWLFGFYSVYIIFLTSDYFWKKKEKLLEEIINQQDKTIRILQNHILSAKQSAKQ